MVRSKPPHHEVDRLQKGPTNGTMDGERVELAETPPSIASDTPKQAGIHIFDSSFASMAIYGSLSVMAVLVAMEDHPPTALRVAAQLFGVTIAIAVAKAYAEIIANTLQRGRSLNAEEWREILRGVSPVLFGSQGPTVVMLMSAFGLFSVDTAIDVSKVLVLVLLFIYGLRVAQLLHTNRLVQLASGLVIMSAGGVVVLINYFFH